MVILRRPRERMAVREMAVRRPIGEMLSHRQKMVLLVTLIACTLSQSLDQAVVATASPSIVVTPERV